MPHHQKRVVEHIRRRHLHMHSTAINRIANVSEPHDVARSDISYEMFKVCSNHSIDSSPNPYNFRGGKIIAPIVPAHKDLVVQHTKRAEPYDRTLAILSSLHPLADAKRPNDFLNTLDLITANLLERL